MQKNKEYLCPLTIAEEDKDQEKKRNGGDVSEEFENGVKQSVYPGQRAGVETEKEADRYSQTKAVKEKAKGCRDVRSQCDLSGKLIGGDAYFKGLPNHADSGSHLIQRVRLMAKLGERNIRA